MNNELENVVRNVLNARARLGEGPLWDEEKQLLYWVDIANHRVHCFKPETGEDCFWEIDAPASAIALYRDGRILMAAGDRIALLDPKTDARETLHRVEFDCPGTRFNDGKCDPQGRFWVGSISPEPERAALYRYTADGSCQVMETGLTISNGLGWNPAGDTFYLTDSPQRKIFAYDFDGETGTIQNRRILIDFGEEAIEPDGLAIDSQGHIWTALWDGWCVVECDRAGQEVRRLPFPVQRPTCPTFGGKDLIDLYVTTASVGLSQGEIQKSFYSGDLFCYRCDRPGLPTHRFGSPLEEY